MSRSPHLEGVAAVALLVATSGACHSEAAQTAVRAPTVRVVAAAERLVTTRVPVSGVLAPLPGRDVNVGALVAGRVDRMFVAEGDRVKVGQPLAHIEAQPLRDKVAEAEAVRDQARAAAENARARLARTEKLFQDGVAARQEVEDARAAAVAAESGRRTALAGLGTASLQLDRATLRAPIDGVVAAILVPAGQSVDGSGARVVEVADLRVLDLRAAVPAARLGEVSIGQRAELVAEGVGAVTGAVEAIAPIVDVATGTVVVRIRVPNGDGKLRGGLFARGALLGVPHRAIAVPRTALLPGDGGAASQVAVVGPDDALAVKAVTLGGDDGDDVEVRSGLAPGDRVVVAGGYTLPPGTKVEVAAEAPGAGAATAATANGGGAPTEPPVAATKQPATGNPRAPTAAAATAPTPAAPAPTAAPPSPASRRPAP